MMGGSRLGLVVTAGLLAVVVCAAQQPAGASDVRHGIILALLAGGGPPETTFYPMDCAAAPDCGAWLASGCRAELTGLDPALESSIVDVSALANGTTQRQLHVTSFHPPVGNVAEGVLVQFWRANCTQVSTSRQVSSSATFAIPSGAKWMTAVGNHNRPIEWGLT